MSSNQDGAYVHPSLRTHGPVRLDVGSEDAIPPTDLARLEENLQASLAAAGVGRVIGSRTFSEPNANCHRSVIQVEVVALEAGIRVLRRALRDLQVPLATWIWQFAPEEVCYEIWTDDDNPPTWGW
jgi:hypothetical protein